MKTIAAWGLGLLVALGLATAGWFVADGVRSAKRLDRHVEVKGLAEREVPADLVIWPLTFSAVANDLTVLQAELERSSALVREFLQTRGIDAGNVSIAPPRITDYQSQGYGRENMPENRFSANQTITVRSPAVATVREAMAATGELLNRNVLLAQTWGPGTETRFLFEGLNDIKPEMIAEATRNARAAAGQFAQDSGSTVGAIRQARQGFFTVEDRDPSSPDVKKVRVVTTVDYYLVD